MSYNYYDLFEMGGWVDSMYDESYSEDVTQDIKEIICRYNDKEHTKERICNFNLLLYGDYNCDGCFSNTAPCPIEGYHGFCWQHQCSVLA